jgi:DNA-binding GntR family transcriptional regulator
MALLEGQCAADTARKASDTDLQRLLDIHAELEEAARTSDIDGFFEANQAFHQEVQLIADNRWLTQAITDLRKVIKLSRHHSLFIDGRIEQSLAEHRLILEALGRRDVGATEIAMREHISSGRRALAKIAAKREATA